MNLILITPKTRIVKYLMTFHHLDQHNNNVTNLSDRLLDLVFFNIKYDIMHDEPPIVIEYSYYPALLIHFQYLSLH